MSQMSITWILNQELPKKGRTQTIQRAGQQLATQEEDRPMANQTTD